MELTRRMDKPPLPPNLRSTAQGAPTQSYLSQSSILPMLFAQSIPSLVSDASISNITVLTVCLEDQQPLSRLEHCLVDPSISQKLADLFPSRHRHILRYVGQVELPNIYLSSYCSRVVDQQNGFVRSHESKTPVWRDNRYHMQD